MTTLRHRARRLHPKFQKYIFLHMELDEKIELSKKTAKKHKQKTSDPVAIFATIVNAITQYTLSYYIMSSIQK